MSSDSELTKPSKAELETLKEKVESRLWRASLFDDYHRLRRCGEKRVIFCQRCGFAHEMASHCMRRFCPGCERRRSDALQAVYVPTLAKVRWPLFVTLTLGGGSDWELSEMVSALKGGLRKMRRHRWFKQKVAGGVGAIELAWADRGWHAHIHALLDCRWLSVTVEEPKRSASQATRSRVFKAAQKEVAAAWSDACGIDPSGIFVRRPTGETTREVLKYSVKPGSFDDENMPMHDLVEVMKGLKMVSPWGSIRKHRRAVKAELDALRVPLKCDCGDPSWRFQ